MLTSLEGTIHSLSIVVEKRDPYTATHQRRVARLAGAIAKTMNLSQFDVVGIGVAGTLHDIGKLHVPAEILAKPSQLSEGEIQIIHTHPQVSFEILESIEFPWPIAQIVLQHHERMDGSGYPLGLSNGYIMIEAKILAVADVVEAMSSHRPYRAALDIDRALGEISQNSDVLYDARVVDSCLRVFNEKDSEFRIQWEQEGTSLSVSTLIM